MHAASVACMKAILLLAALLLALLAPAWLTGVTLNCASMDPNFLLSCD